MIDILFIVTNNRPLTPSRNADGTDSLETRGKAMDTFPDNKIKGQIKQHWKKFHELMSEVENKIDDLNRNDTNTN